MVRIYGDVWGTIRDDGRDGSFESITNTTGTILVTENSGFDFNEVGVWEFDLSDLPDGLITSVTLEVQNLGGTLDLGPYNIKNFIGDGVISTSDATVGSLLVENIPGQVGVFELDVTSLILDPVTLAAGFAGFSVEYFEPVLDANRQKNFAAPGQSCPASVGIGVFLELS